MKKSLLFLTILLLTFEISAQQKGTLFIIGGGNRTDKIMKKLVLLAGGEKAKVIVIPNASSDKKGTAEYQIKQFKEFGCTNSDFLFFNKENADADSNLSKIEGAQLIFFSGGDQNKLTQDLLGTKLIDKIKEVYNNGGVISGTSAGAAVMSSIMITGEELINKDSSNYFNSIQAKNIQTAEGFGFVADAVIDQHFIKRKRNNRLISVVLENPEKLGIGIDESTAIIIYPDDTFEVTGESQVIVYDATEVDVKTKNDSNQFSSSLIKMHILTDGQKYDLKKKIIIK